MLKVEDKVYVVDESRINTNTGESVGTIEIVKKSVGNI